MLQETLTWNHLGESTSGIQVLLILTNSIILILITCPLFDKMKRDVNVLHITIHHRHYCKMWRDLTITIGIHNVIDG